MKAMLVDENKSLVWSDVPDPTVGDDEMLIEIYAAALNRADLMQREGDYPHRAAPNGWALKLLAKLCKWAKLHKVKVIGSLATKYALC